MPGKGQSEPAQSVAQLWKRHSHDHASSAPAPDETEERDGFAWSASFVRQGVVVRLAVALFVWRDSAGQRGLASALRSCLKSRSDEGY